jgi:hypothetical protein
VLGAGSAHRPADDPDEPRPVQRACGGVHAFDLVLMSVLCSTDPTIGIGVLERSTKPRSLELLPAILTSHLGTRYEGLRIEGRV